MQAVVPLYIHPLDQPVLWQRLGQQSFGFDQAIVNVHSGPGARRDAVYAEVLADVDMPLLGYVTVGYGARSEIKIREQADRWRRWYGVASIFLDEMPSDAHPLSFRLADCLRDDGCDRVIANPGCEPAVNLRGGFDAVCSFEGSWSAYTRRSLVVGRNDLHLVHSVPTALLPVARELLAHRGAAYGWVTDKCMPNPWNAMPAGS